MQRARRGRRPVVVSIRLQGLLFLVVVVVVVGACAQTGASGIHAATVPDTSAAPGVRVTAGAAPGGVLQGHLYGAGGPAPGRRVPWPGTITVTGPAGARDVVVDPTGAYTLTLPPGRYAIEGHSPRYEGGAATCRSAAVAAVVAGATTTLDTVCSMR